MTTITDATNIAASTTDAKTTSTNNAASQGVNNTPTVLTSVPTAAGPPTSAPVTSATIPTIRLPTYRAIPDGWTKRRMLNVCNLTLGLTFMQHDQVRRQYAIDTAKELWWPLARSPWIGEILDNHLRKLHAEDVREMKRRVVRAAAATENAVATANAAASGNATASANGAAAAAP